MPTCGQQIVIKRPNHQHLHTDISDFDSSVTNIINSTILNSASANWQSVYSTVCSLSAEWESGGGIDLTVLSANSACWQAACAGNTVFQNNSANYGSVYTVVNSNSANWNYQGTDIKSISSDWQNTYTNFSTQSANNISIYTTVNANSSVWNTSFVHLSGDIMTGGLSAPSLSTNTLYVGASTIYFINADGQVTNYLNSQDVLNFRNNFTSTTTNSGNWQSVYSTVNNLSTQWIIDLDNTEVNSFVISNSANIVNVDSFVQNNSATWATIDYAQTNFVNSSGDHITGNIEIYNNAQDSKITLYSNPTDSNRVVVHYQTLTGESLFTKYTNYWGDWFVGIHPDEPRFIMNFGGVGNLDTNNFEFDTGGTIHAYRFLTSNGESSIEWTDTYTIVSNNSAVWGAGGGVDLTVISTNSACWQAACADNTVFQNNSANYESVYTTVNSTSSVWSNKNTNIFVNAASMIPRTTNGCGVNSFETSTNKINYDTLDFDAASIEYAQFMIMMPSNWNGGTVTAKFFWTAQSGSGDVVWKLAGRALADDDAIDSAMGTAQSATDTLTSAGDMDISTTTAAITIAGSPTSATPIQFEVCRGATDGADTLAVDANLLGISITFGVY